MKTFDISHADIVDFENLLEADKNASKGKHYRDENLKFSAHREEGIIDLLNQLTYFHEDGDPDKPLVSSYHVGRYRRKQIYEPKPRVIMALQYRDRLVQWAYYQKLNPLFDRQFITHSYGCRDDKGTTKARAQLQTWIRKANRSPKKWYVLKLDIAKYFYRVDHDVLMNILSKHIKDELILQDLNKLINCEETAFGLPAGVQPELCKSEDWLYNRGMPIGNLTSQMFANIYLNELDQYCKHDLKIKYYIRYMDDIVILWPDKEELKQILSEIERFLDEVLHLELNNKTCIRPAFLPVTFVGAQITAKKIRMRRSTRKRMFKRIKFIQKLFEAGQITFEKVNNTMQSYFGLIQHFTAGNLLRKIIDEFSFRIF
ncbi:reverse transcriptase/maturase family protein [Anaerocolumna xylanovorans]|uniref:Reverse transcriptase (RNA-dependent DNA polymerase) n=1 Tax=Anaerocolumna xylanovorans DSM 12503 TaxID=1121345 RepID=A0A1M7YBQ7_9FIRM|nr:reverse transcriptase/maturase family protein [Anaerocolumna xylanovorans]SHO50053.1 Reverse transcriptase (RNA-dependent DNA polymerase) [Anaerocolumna xylanovorans DSM 12503]